MGVIDKIQKGTYMCMNGMECKLKGINFIRSGKFLPTIAWRIDNENQLDALSGDPNLASINLRGIISISGFSDPIHQIDYGEFYYNMGLIDGEQVKHFHTKETLGKSYIRSRKFYEAYQVSVMRKPGNVFLT